jgi:hypothetical protein
MQIFTYIRLHTDIQQKKKYVALHYYYSQVNYIDNYHYSIGCFLNVSQKKCKFYIYIQYIYNNLYIKLINIYKHIIYILSLIYLKSSSHKM